jgi:hypothetical protein
MTLRGDGRREGKKTEIERGFSHPGTYERRTFSSTRTPNSLDSGPLSHRREEKRVLGKGTDPFSSLYFAIYFATSLEGWWVSTPVAHFLGVGTLLLSSTPYSYRR